MTQWVFTIPVTLLSVRRLLHEDIVENAKRIGRILFGSDGTVEVHDSTKDNQRVIVLIYNIDLKINSADDPKYRKLIKHLFISKFVRPGFNHDLCEMQVSHISNLGMATLQTAISRVEA